MIANRACTLAVALLAWLASAVPALAQSFDQGQRIERLDLADFATTQLFTLADVNGDQFPDIVTAGFNPESSDPAVIVLFSDGGFGFRAATYFVDDEVEDLEDPIAVQVADVGSPTESDNFGDPDGNPDIIVLDTSAELVIVLWGDGAGGFEFSSDGERFDLTDLLGGEAVGLAVGNFDGQAGTDAVVLDSGGDAGQLIFLCSLARAPFISCTDAALSTEGDEPLDVVTGDFNGNGTTDVVVLNTGPNDGNLTLFSGGGDGAFRRETGAGNPAVLGQAEAVDMTVARVDGDALDDVIVVFFEDFEGLSIQSFLGRQGRLTGQAIQIGPLSAAAVAGADFDGDNITDVAIAESENGITFVTRGDGDGAFLAAGAPTGGQSTGMGVAIQAADLDRDRDIDFVVATDDYTGFRIALNLRVSAPTPTGPTRTPTPTAPPTATFTPTPVPTIPFDACSIPIGGQPVSATAAQLNSDVNYDVVVADTEGRIQVLSPNPGTIRTSMCSEDFLEENFTITTTGLSGAPTAVGAGNLDRGLVADDLAVAVGGSIFLLHGNGSGGFTVNPTPLALPTPSTVTLIRKIVIDDINTDGRPDIITANQGHPVLVVFEGLNGGGFEAGRPLDVSGAGATDVIVTNIDDGNSLDLVAIVAGSGQTTQIVGFRQTGSLTFTPQNLIDAGSLGGQATALVAEDFNGDEVQDLAIAVRTSTAGKVAIFSGPGFGQTSELTGIGDQLLEDPVALAVGDLDLEGTGPDGDLDLAIADAGDGGRLFFGIGSGTGAFAARAPLMIDPDPVSVTVADVDGDGKADVIVAHSGGSLRIVRSSQPFPTATPTLTPTPTETPTQGSPTATQPTETPEPPPPGSFTPTGTIKPGAFALSDGCTIGADGSGSGLLLLGAGILGWLARRRSALERQT